MSSDQRYVDVPGSEREPYAGARRVADAPADEPVEVTVLLQRKDDAAGAVAERAQADPVRREDLDPGELAARFGAAEGDVEKVAAFARANGLEVVDRSAGQRRVALRGPAAAMGEAFGVSLGRYENAAAGVAYRGREGAVQIPAELDGVVTAVLGLDDRPAAKPRLVRAAAVAPPQAFAVPDIAKVYDFPAGGASDQWVGIIELGGGFRDADLQAYFGSIGMATPTVEAISVDGARNTPGQPADGEVMLDIEVVGAVAPGVRIAVYFAPNTTRGFVDAILAAAHDAQRRPSVFSISWGMQEPNWTAQGVAAMNQAFEDAGLVGMTVTAAAGDDGAQDGATDGTAQADFPASSPYVLGCGGTRLVADDGRIGAETVWNDGDGSAGGGGVSRLFPVPAWQAGSTVGENANPGGGVGRGVPDVAGVGDPETGYRIRVDGRDAVFGGTSAVAPLWAGLIALCCSARRTRLGFLNPKLYELAAAERGFHDVTEGDNVVGGAPGYRARPGWDACTGNGSPIGTELLSAL